MYKTRAYSILSRSYELERISGTYIFHGEDGSGRWLMAISIAALLNCEGPIKSEEHSNLFIPCGQCRNCLNIFALNHESLKLIIPVPPHENKLDKAIDLTNEFVKLKRDEAFTVQASKTSTNIPISLAREVKKSLALKAMPNQRRVVIFYRMEKMLFSSADALLKLIEEPPDDTILILICAKVDSLPQTIQSRAQKIKIDKNSEEDIRKYLDKHYEISEHRANLLSKISGGSIGRAIEMFNSGSEDSQSQRAVLFMVYKSLFYDENPETLALMSDVLTLRDKAETEELLRLWQVLIRDTAYYAVTGDDTQIVNIDFESEIKKISPYFELPSLAPALTEEIKITLADLKLNVHIQGALMALTLKMKAHIRKSA